jgi:hypothetical protein
VQRIRPELQQLNAGLLGRPSDYFHSGGAQSLDERIELRDLKAEVNEARRAFRRYRHELDKRVPVD